MKSINAPKEIHAWTMMLGVLCGLGIFPALFFAFMTVFMFDSPGAASSTVTLFLAGSFWLLPFTCLAACVGGVICSLGKRSRAKNIAASVFVSLPILNILFIYFMLYLLDTVCGGYFDCNPQI